MTERITGSSNSLQTALATSWSTKSQAKKTTAKLSTRSTATAIGFADAVADFGCYICSAEVYRARLFGYRGNIDAHALSRLDDNRGREAMTCCTFCEVSFAEDISGSCAATAVSRLSFINRLYMPFATGSLSQTASAADTATTTRPITERISPFLTPTKMHRAKTATMSISTKKSVAHPSVHSFFHYITRHSQWQTFYY